MTLEELAKWLEELDNTQYLKGDQTPKLFAAAAAIRELHARREAAETCYFQGQDATDRLLAECDASPNPS